MSTQSVIYTLMNINNRISVVRYDNYYNDPEVPHTLSDYTNNEQGMMDAKTDLAGLVLSGGRFMDIQQIPNIKVEGTLGPTYRGVYY